MLERYFSVLEGKEPAIHQVTRAISVDGPIETMDLVELWENHRKGMEEYRVVLEDRPRLDEVLGSDVENSLLDLKIAMANEMLTDCCFCERRCGVDRRAGKTGYCGVGYESRYASEFLHMGEEVELVPSHTIFFSGCTFRCVYCQNWDIAMHPESGRVVEISRMARCILDAAGSSRNVNFVGGNPDPNLHTILEIVRELGGGSRYLPLVWNSNMYTSREAMDLLDGIIDIYLGDFRYGNDRCARELSDVEDYFHHVARNFYLAYDRAEVMLRHLVLPGHLDCCSRPIMKWVSQNMPDVYFNLMFQYHPEFRATLFPPLDRRLTAGERQDALKMAKGYGLNIS